MDLKLILALSEGNENGAPRWNLEDDYPMFARERRFFRRLPGSARAYGCAAESGAAGGIDTGRGEVKCRSVIAVCAGFDLEMDGAVLVFVEDGCLHDARFSA